MPQQNHRFFVVISSLKYTLQNVVFLRTIKANLLFCEQAHARRRGYLWESNKDSYWNARETGSMHIAVKTAILAQWERKCIVGSPGFTCKISKN